MHRALLVARALLTARFGPSRVSHYEMSHERAQPGRSGGERGQGGAHGGRAAVRHQTAVQAPSVRARPLTHFASIHRLSETRAR
jgi:hypothetical protein